MIEILKKKKNFISYIIPKLFSNIHKEYVRGNRLGMDVGKGRERVVICLLKILTKYKIKSQLNDIYNGDCFFIKNKKTKKLIEIKTYTGNDFKNIKIKWTVDKKSCHNFVKNYQE